MNNQVAKVLSGMGVPGYKTPQEQGSNKARGIVKVAEVKGEEGCYYATAGCSFVGRFGGLAQSMARAEDTLPASMWGSVLWLRPMGTDVWQGFYVWGLR